MSQQIKKWLQTRGLRVHQMSDHHWILPLEHDGAAYSLTIKEFGDWFSYGAELIPDVEGQNLTSFYSKMLEMNSILNGTQIGKQGNKLVLIRNDLMKHLNEDNFMEGLAIFNRSHEYVYGIILKEGAELGLKFKTL